MPSRSCSRANSRRNESPASDVRLFAQRAELAHREAGGNARGSFYAVARTSAAAQTEMFGNATACRHRPSRDTRVIIRETASPPGPDRV